MSEVLPLVNDSILNMLGGGSQVPARYRAVYRCLDPWNPDSGSHWGGRPLASSAALATGCLGLPPHLEPPSFSCWDRQVDIAEMCGFRSSVLLVAADGPIFLGPFLSASGPWGDYCNFPPSLSSTFCDTHTHTNTHTTRRLLMSVFELLNLPLKMRLKAVDMKGLH